MPSQKTQLIKDGKLVNFMSDRVGELKTGHKATGSGRRQSYRFAPASRMRNTYIEPGNDTLEEMISSYENKLQSVSTFLCGYLWLWLTSQSLFGSIISPTSLDIQ